MVHDKVRDRPNAIELPGWMDPAHRGITLVRGSYARTNAADEPLVLICPHSGESCYDAKCDESEICELNGEKVTFVPDRRAA